MPVSFLESGGTSSAVLEVVSLVAATMLGAIFRAYSGFGAGLFLIPAFSLIMLPSDAIVLVTLLNMPTTLQMLPGLNGIIPWRRVLNIAGTALLTIPMGVYLLMIADGALLRKGIGVIVIAFSLLLMSGWRYTGSRGPVQDASVGIVTGAISGATGMGGPPVILYLLSGDVSPTVARATFVASFFAITLATLGGFFLAGMVHAGLLWWFIGLLPVYAFGTWVGTRLHERIAHMAEVFRKTSLVALMAVGMLAILS